ncbi:MAG: ABC transporter permease [Bacilli bacterium]
MILTLAFRHLKIYFRDKLSVFFSLLSVIIIIGLYVLFLGELVNDPSIDGYRTMMDNWIMSGVIAVGGFTVTLGAYGILVDDKAKKIERDFVVAPIKPRTRIIAYIISTAVIGVIMSIFTLMFAQIYILIYGGPFMKFFTLIKIFGLIVLNVVTASSIIFFIILFVKTSSSYSALATIVGTLIGFLMGIYVPIGQLPAIIQTIIMFFPFAHAGVLFRIVMMEDSLAYVFNGAPAETLQEIQALLGIRFYVDGQPLPIYTHFLVLGGTIALFFLLSMIVLRFKKQK